MAGPWEKYQAASDGPWSKYAASPDETTLGQDIKQGAGNLLAGAVRGAGSIGATLLWPIDKAQDLIYNDRNTSITSLVTGKGTKPLSRNEERRQAMDDALRSLGADPDSWMYKGGKLGAEIAGTAGAGTMLANGMRAVPLLAKAGPLIDAVRTGGMSAGRMSGLSGLGVRAAGGAITGAASAGAVNPEDALTGAAIGGAFPVATKVSGTIGKTIGNAASGLISPMTAKGQKEIAADILRASATDPANAVKAASRAAQFVPGSKPTMGQVAADPGLAQLERTLLNNPESAGPLATRYAEQQAARKAVIAGVAGSPDYRAAIEEGRRVFANQDYATAFKNGIDEQMAKALKPQINSLLHRPSIQSAKQTAKSLAAEQDIALTKFGSLEGLDWLKKGLDNEISAATSGASSIGKEKLRALMQTKNDLMQVMEQIAPAYKTANDNFAAMSRQINAGDVAADLQKRLYKNAEWGSGKEMGAAYQSALLDAIDSIKRQTGMNKSLSDVMPPSDIAALEGIAKDLARKENAQNLGRAVGSPTMQNMLGQSLINRIAAPLGAPRSIAQGVVASLISRPYNFVMKSAEPKIQGLLGEAMADPEAARRLLLLTQQVTQTRPRGLLGNTVDELLPAMYRTNPVLAGGLLSGQ